MGTIKTTNIEPIADNGTVTLGSSGDTITIPSGVTITNSGTASGFGKLLQVVQETDTTQLSTTSTSLVDTGITASITPSSSSNKILILAECQAQFGSDTGFGNAIVRDSTVIFQTNNYSNYDSSSTQTNTRASYVKLDSPSTTSAITYKLQVYCYNPGTVIVNETSNPTTLTLMEIAG